MSPLLQNVLVVIVILGFAAMEYASRRYTTTVHANPNDTKLEALMFVSLIAIAQPVALLGADKLCAWLIPGQRGAWADLPWWAMVGLFLVALIWRVEGRMRRRAGEIRG